MSQLGFRLQAGLRHAYRIEESIGFGGMAEVFSATDLVHSRPVAIKVLRPEVAAIIGPGRFLREIKTTSQLKHDRLVELLDSGEVDGLLYYVMPRAAHGSLRDLLDAERQLPIERASEILVDIALALDAAHQARIVHRDLKPENILFMNGRAAVADFGIARLVDDVGPERLSETGVVFGTPHYMSPEQSSGSHRVDQRSDVYSLGCVLYEMLAGEPPFTGPTRLAIEARHRCDAMPPLRTLRPTLPRAAENAVRRALSKVPADRFPTAGAFANAFEAGTRATSVRHPPSRSLALAAAAAVVAALVVGAWFVKSRSRDRTPPPSAPRSWVMVADFDGPASDPDIADATRDMISAVLDQSSICATVPRAQIRNAMMLAGRPVTSRLDPELARELAYRRAIRAVIEGSVKRLGPGYTIVVRVVDADSERVLAIVSETARSQEELIGSVSKISTKILRSLGANASSMQATRRYVDVITPSFPAYRKFVEANKYIFREPRTMVALLHEALALDPDFASAWEGLFWYYGKLGRDSALIAGQEALRRPHRLTASARLNIEASMAETRGDISAALDLYRRAIAANANALGPRNNRAILFNSMGRYEEAIHEYREAKTVSALPIPVLDLNEFESQIALGRLDEAERLQRGITALPDAIVNPLYIATARADWPVVERLAHRFAADDTAHLEVRLVGEESLAITAAVRGAVEEADQALIRSSRWTDEIGYPSETRSLAWSRLLLRRISATTLPSGAICADADTSLANLVVRGMEAAGRRDVLAAKRIAARVRENPAHRVLTLGAAPAVLESWIAGQGGDWERSRDLLLPVAQARGEYGPHDFAAGRVVICWQLADAFERLGQPDSAATYLAMALDSTGPPTQVIYQRGLAWSFLHRRLAELYARAGRADLAARHLDQFAREFTRPDLGLRTAVEDTRRRVLSEAVANPQARQGPTVP